MTARLVAFLFGVVLTCWTAELLAAPAGVVIDRIDVTLQIPDWERDAKLTTKHTVSFTVRSSSYSTKLPLAIAPTIVTAKDAATGLPVIASRRTTGDDAFTDLVLPNGASTIQMEFSVPLFESAHPRFWWTETQAVLGWPFTPDLKPVTQGVLVTIIGPQKLARPPGFPCVSEGTNMKCSRFFSPAEVARFADTKDKGVRIGGIPIDDPMPFVLSGGQVGLWCLLIGVVALWRRPRIEPKERLWMFARTALALAIFVPMMAAWAYVADGEISGPLVTSMSWAAAIFGVIGLMYAQLKNDERPFRTKIGQLAMLVAMPLGVAALALLKEGVAGLSFAGGAAVVGFLFMHGESSS